MKMAIELIGNNATTSTELREDLQKEADLVLQCKKAKLICNMHAIEDDDFEDVITKDTVLLTDKEKSDGSDGLDIAIQANTKELKVQESKEQASPKSESQSIVSVDASNKDVEEPLPNADTEEANDQENDDLPSKEVGNESAENLEKESLQEIGIQKECLSSSQKAKDAITEEVETNLENNININKGTTKESEDVPNDETKEHDIKEIDSLKDQEDQGEAENDNDSQIRQEMIEKIPPKSPERQDSQIDIAVAVLENSTDTTTKDTPQELKENLVNGETTECKNDTTDS
jgi:hypothetical protein